MKKAAEPSTTGRSGFALLEAIIAIVILASALLPIYGLISTSVNGAFRLGRANQHSEIVLNALEVMTAVNPFLHPSGSISLGLYDIAWQADPVLPPIDGTNFPRGVSLFQIGLYDTHVVARSPEGLVLADFTVRQVGFRRTRDIAMPFSPQ